MSDEIIADDGSRMVKIPAGPFIYGSSDEQLLPLFSTKELAQKIRDQFIEIEAREETTEAYYIDVFPVTNAQFLKFLEANPKHPKRPKYLDHPRFGAKDSPVVGVDWDDAAAYAKWAKKMLPSEEQWEKAARGEDGRLFPWGNEQNPSFCNCAEVAYSSTSPEGRFSDGRSPFGVEDMAGNVWEMTTGQWRKSSKTMRGGAFLTRFSYCHTTMRWTPAAEELAEGAKWLGFRCVRPA